MNERIKELRKQVKVDMHLHNVEDIKAMEGCFGFEGGNKIVNDYMEKFAELIVRECAKVANVHSEGSELHDEGTLYYYLEDIAVKIKQHFGVEE